MRNEHQGEIGCPTKEYGRGQEFSSTRSVSGFTGLRVDGGFIEGLLNGRWTWIKSPRVGTERLAKGIAAVEVRG